MYDPAGRQHSGPLVGREEELRELQRQFEMIERLVGQESEAQRFEVLAQRPYGVFLLGEAGIGKTRLAEELARWAQEREWAVVWNRAYEQERIVPYWLWSKVLRSCLQLDLWKPEQEDRPALFQPLTKLLPELADRWPAGENLPASPSESEPFLLWEAALAVFKSLSSQAPVLLVLDDVQWADEGSCKLLGYLLRRLVGSRVLIMGTCRQEELTGNALEPLIGHLQRERLVITRHVHALSKAQIYRLLSSFPARFSPAVIQRIQKQAAGNPFFAEELARSASLDSEPRLPKSIAGALSLRLERLSPACQRLLSKAAVLGGSFDVKLISALEESMSPRASIRRAATLEVAHEPDDAHQSGGPQPLRLPVNLEGKNPHRTANEDMFDLLEEALQAGILTETGTGAHITFSFWHPLMATHLYEGLSAVRRTKLHRQAARVLQQVHAERLAEQAAIITHHLLKADASAQDIVYYAEMAGDHAYALSSYPEAEKHYRIVLQSLKIPLEKICQDPTVDNSVTNRGAQSTVDSSTKNRRARFIAASPDLSGERPPHAQIDKQTGAGPTYLPSNVINLLPSLCNLPLYEQLRTIEILTLLGECASIQGKYEEARQLYQQTLHFRQQQLTTRNPEEYQREAQTQALLWCEIGRTWYDMGKNAQARECYCRGEEILRTAGIIAGAVWAYIRFRQAYAGWREANYSEARIMAREALNLFEEAFAGLANEAENSSRSTFISRILAGDPISLARTHALLGMIANGAGRSTEALQEYTIALGMYERYDSRRDIAVVCCNLGDLQLRRSDYASAQAFFQRSLQVAEQIGDSPLVPFVLANLSLIEMRRGNLIEAESGLAQGIALTEHLNDAMHLSNWCTYQSSVLLDQGKLAEASHVLYRAWRIAKALHITPYIGFAQVVLGEIRIAQAMLMDIAESADQPAKKKIRTLERAKRILLSTIAIEGLEAETRTEGRVALGQAMLLLGEIEQAHNVATQALVEAQQFELTWLLARTQRLLGSIHAAQKQAAKAAAYFEQALAIFRSTGMLLECARTLQQYGELLVQCKDGNEKAIQHGHAYLREARELFELCGAGLDLQIIKRNTE
jgi:tetratricopeptide (TPR) repeat protein